MIRRIGVLLTVVILLVGKVRIAIWARCAVDDDLAAAVGVASTRERCCSLRPCSKGARGVRTGSIHRRGFRLQPFAAETQATTQSSTSTRNR